MRFVLLFLIIFISSAFSREYTVGFAQTTFDNDWMLAQVKHFKDEIEKHENIKLIVKNANGKVSKQIRHIEQFTKDNVDFIVTCPLNKDILPLALNKAMKKDIKVILLSRGVNGNNYTTFISPNNKNIANDAAKYLINKIDKSGVILMLQGIKDVTSSIQREEGFDEIANKYQNIKIIKKRANYLRSDAIKVMEEIYRKDIKFDAIYAQSDSMLIGAREVIKKYEGKMKYPSVSIDYIKQTQKAILNGEQSASFLYPTSGKEGALVVIDLINKKEVAKKIDIKSTIITKENAKKIDPIF